MDGEKDPRNLLICFQIVNKMLESLEIGTNAEGIFEVIFCYFPITFRAPPDDPYGITSEDLKGALKACLCSSNHFAEFSVPLILEKLSSASVAAKKDSLDLLTSALPVYGADTVAVHVDAMWDLFKLEVLDKRDDAVEALALAGIFSLTETVSKSTSPTLLTTYLNSVVKDSMEELLDLDKKNARQVGKLLRSVTSASDPASHHIVEATVNTLMERFPNENTATQKRVILDVLDSIVVGCNEFYNRKKESVFKSPILAHKDRLAEMFRSAGFANKEYSLFRVSGVIGMKHLCEGKRVMSDIEVRTTVLLSPKDKSY